MQRRCRADAEQMQSKNAQGTLWRCSVGFMASDSGECLRSLTRGCNEALWPYPYIGLTAIPFSVYLWDSIARAESERFTE